MSSSIFYLLNVRLRIGVFSIHGNQFRHLTEKMYRNSKIITPISIQILKICFKIANINFTAFLNFNFFKNAGSCPEVKIINYAFIKTQKKLFSK